MSKSQDDYLERIIRIHQQLGIPDSYRENCKLPLCIEPDELVDTEPDFYQRPQKLTSAASEAWLSMQRAAAEDDTVIHLISAYRSVEYQCELIEKKLADNQQLKDILTVNAAPGYSEHHTGRAVDLGTINCRALEIEFDKTPAFQWLENNADRFGFVMTYPVDNQYGITYEPWHWCYQV